MFGKDSPSKEASCHLSKPSFLVAQKQEKKSNLTLLFLLLVTLNKVPTTEANAEILVFLQTASSAIKGAIQLGIGYTVGNLTSKPDRDVLMQDFYVVESVFLPR